MEEPGDFYKLDSDTESESDQKDKMDDHGGLDLLDITCVVCQ